jgi:hypothetical protein
MSVHFRARGNLAKYSAASRKSLSVNMLLSSSTLPTALQVWQSGKELGHGDPRHAMLAPLWDMLIPLSSNRSIFFPEILIIRDELPFPFLPLL